MHSGIPFHEQQNVRAAGLFLSVVGVLHDELIHSPESVLSRLLKIDEGHHPCQTVLGHELDAEHHPTIQLVQGGKIAFAACKMHGIVELVDLPGSQVRGILFRNSLKSASSSTSCLDARGIALPAV